MLQGRFCGFGFFGLAQLPVSRYVFGFVLSFIYGSFSGGLGVSYVGGLGFRAFRFLNPKQPYSGALPGQPTVRVYEEVLR